jgi:hypothetical protein
MHLLDQRRPMTGILYPSRIAKSTPRRVAICRRWRVALLVNCFHPDREVAESAKQPATIIGTPKVILKRATNCRERGSVSFKNLLF